MKLLVVIPALNEEQSIESIILRVEAAKAQIIKNTKVSAVSTVVVSDGSTDQTVTIAQRYPDKANLIIFEQNKGYGAAIKAGWDSDPEADLLAFIDADGTCDPLFFEDLCNLIIEQQADIALGSRLNEKSQMPLIRRIGNTLFSILLSLVSNKRVKDTASGMRVIRRSVLHKIMPLPDGLHFTPAMSARAILSEDVNIQEKDMAYSEREGESKLKVWKDGKRFLSIILENVFLYAPYRIFSLIAYFFIALASLIIAPPFIFYVQHQSLEDSMFYRFIVSAVLGIIGLLLLSVSSITKNVVNFTLRPNAPQPKTFLYYMFESRGAVLISLLCFIIGSLLILNSVWDRITTGLTNEHWSRYILMIVTYLSGTIVLVTLATNKVLQLVKNRLLYLQSLAA